MNKLRVIGLMSGTSLDGCDAVLVEIAPLLESDNRVNITTIDYICHPMPENLRIRIQKQLNPDTSRIDELTSLDALLSRWFADAVFSLLKKTCKSADDIDVIGCHGQTMWHSVNNDDKIHNMTWQLGDGSFIASLTGITTVCDFRTADVALGGQGAPLIPFFDNLMYGGHTINIALQNIGGIGNVTLVPREGSGESTSIGFDTGPGNMVIDRFVEIVTNGKELFDKDGYLAAQGTMCNELLDSWMKHPFLLQIPPKSTGREEFGHSYADERFAEATAQGLSGVDSIATATALTARSIGDAYRLIFSGPNASLYPHRVIVSGGGAANVTLMRMLQEELSPAVVSRAGYGDDDLEISIISSDSKEAVAFALFAYQAVLGRPNHLPNTTGACRETILGKICPGRNYRRLLFSSLSCYPDKPAVNKVEFNDCKLPSMVTETRNASSMRLDDMSADEIVQLMNEEDSYVFSAVASLRTIIAKEAERIAACIDAGGHVYYIGAGTSGRLGVLDASEIPPTFSAPFDWFQGIIAGGDGALRRAVEGAEDSREEGARDIIAKGLNSQDIVIGIASSGSTPYVHGALQASKTAANCRTALITCNYYPDKESYIDTVISAVVGPEIITGSTRLKAGTATKLILNQLSTTAMVLSGKTYGNLMVDLKVSNNKLKIRAIGIITTVLGVDRAEAEQLLVSASGRVKVAIAMHVTGGSESEAERQLHAHQNRLGKLINTWTRK